MGKELGKAIRQARLGTTEKLTQKQLAAQVKRDGSLISKIETGQEPPTPDLLQMIVGVLTQSGATREDLAQILRTAEDEKVLLSPMVDPLIAAIQDEFQQITSPDQRDALRQALQRTLQHDRELRGAEEDRHKRRWAAAVSKFVGIKDRHEKNCQKTNALLDANLGDCQYSLADLTSALHSYHSALYTATVMRDRATQADQLVRIGDVHRRRGGTDWALAHQRYDQAFEIHGTMQDLAGQAECLRKRAGAYLFEGRPALACDCATTSLKMSIRAADKVGEIKSLQHHGWCLQLLGEVVRAVALLESAVAESQDDWTRIKGLRYLGDAYGLAGNLSKAEDAFLEALELFKPFEAEHVEASRTVGLTHLGLGRILLQQPNRAYEANLHLTEGERMHGGIGDDYRAFEFWLARGELAVCGGDLAAAEQPLLNAIEAYKRSMGYSQQVAAQAVLAEAYAGQPAQRHELVNVLSDARTAARLAKTDAASANTESNLSEGRRGAYRFQWTPKTDDRPILADRYLARIEVIVAKAWINDGDYRRAGATLRDAAERARPFPDEFMKVYQDAIVASSSLRITEAQEALQPLVGWQKTVVLTTAEELWARPLLNTIEQLLNGPGA